LITGGFIFGLLLNYDEVGKLAPIAVEMRPERRVFEAAVLERKAGCPFLNCFTVSLQKNTIIADCLIKTTRPLFEPGCLQMIISVRNN